VQINTLAFEVSAATPLVKVDPHQLEMALLNLVVNARDAMPKGGTITICASSDETPPPALRGGHYVCLRVIDQGEGMDTETLSKARDPFFTTKGIGKGTGLGLPMVAGFAEQTGGLMVLDSETDKGTVVELWLPQALEAEGHSSRPSSVNDSAEAVGLKRHIILAVDDDALVLMNTEAMLEDLGAIVIATTSPLEALELISTRSDLTCVVSDYAMPKMTGGELLMQSRTHRPDLPFVIATGYNEAPVSGPATTLLVKPFTDQALHLAVREVCAFRAEKKTPVLQ
jgi:CheY-like chemotaxis protein